jgi:hypothetical protein
MPSDKDAASRDSRDAKIKRAVDAVGDEIVRRPADASHPEKTKRPSRKRRLTPLGKKILTELIRDPDQTQSEIARKVGSTHVSVKNVMIRQSTQEIMREMMENDPELSKTLSRRALLVKLSEGLDATSKYRAADKGFVKTEKTDIDYRTRGIYLNLAAEITGAKSQKVELTGANGAPLLPAPLTSALEAMDEAALVTLLQKLMKE